MLNETLRYLGIAFICSAALIVLSKIILQHLIRRPADYYDAAEAYQEELMLNSGGLSIMAEHVTTPEGENMDETEAHMPQIGPEEVIERGLIDEENVPDGVLDQAPSLPEGSPEEISGIRIAPLYEIDEAPETEIEAEAELEPETEAEAEAELEPETEIEVEAELEPETEIEVEAELEPETEAEAGAELEPETEIEAGAELEPEPETEIEAEAEIEPETEAEAEAELEPEAEAEAGIEVGAEAETESEPETGTEPEAEPQRRTQAEDHDEIRRLLEAAYAEQENPDIPLTRTGRPRKPSMSMRKTELIAIAESLDLEISEGSTKRDILGLINTAIREMEDRIDQR